MDDTVGGIGVVALGEERAAGGRRVRAATTRIRTPTWADGIETEIGVTVFQSWSAPLEPAFDSCTVAELGAGHLVDERREDVVEAKIGDCDGQHPLLDLDLLELDAGMSVDGRVGERRAGSHELEQGLEQERDARPRSP